ncbi:MAG TPA: hypothetical protein VFR67_28780 [Pilimelia sp.]|nr:hypothetical protein [Pilimelia sp.]
MAHDGHGRSTLRIGGWLPGRTRSDRPPADQAAVTELIPAVAEPAPAYPKHEPDIDATPPGRPPALGGRGRRRASRRTPHAAKIVVAAAVTAAVAAGIPLALALGSRPPAPQYVLPAPTPPWPEPETPRPGTPPPTPSGSRPPSHATASPSASIVRPPAPQGATPSPGRTDGPLVVDPPPIPPIPPVAPEPVNLAFEAESLEVSGNTRPKQNAAASGGSVVGWVGNGSGNTLRVVVTVPDASAYSVTLFYISATSRQATVRVNEGTAALHSFPATGDWSTVTALTLRLDLRAGPNTIELGNPAAYGPDFDRVSVSRWP